MYVFLKLYADLKEKIFKFTLVQDVPMLYCTKFW